MNQPPLLILWFVELIKRFGTKSPFFFKALSWFSGLLAALATLPQALAWLNVVHISIPFLDTHAGEIVRYSSLGILFASLLTSQSKPTGIDQEGNIIKTTDTQKLPFTATSEQKIVDKDSIPAVTVKPLIND